MNPEDEIVENGEAAGDDEQGDARDPSGFLSEIIGAPVTVKLNSGIVYKGVCYCLLLFVT
jgi:U6 snRNA-associated Sm-like protein LSm6